MIDFFFLISPCEKPLQQTKALSKVIELCVTIMDSHGLRAVSLIKKGINVKRKKRRKNYHCNHDYITFSGYLCFSRHLHIFFLNSEINWLEIQQKYASQQESWIIVSLYLPLLNPYFYSSCLPASLLAANCKSFSGSLFLRLFKCHYDRDFTKLLVLIMVHKC